MEKPIKQAVRIKPPVEAHANVVHAMRGLAAEIAKLPKEKFKDKTG
jgi:hypothetical protein